MKNFSLLFLLVFTAIQSIAQCPPLQTNFADCDYVLVGHRGYSSVYPENTLLSIEEAFKRGVKYCEVDVSLTSEGKYVLFHDEHSVYRTTNGTGNISEHSLATLQLLDAGSWKGEQFKGTKIPTLVDALKIAEKYDAFLYLDMKNTDYAKLKEAMDEAQVAPNRFLPSISTIVKAQEFRALLPQTPWVWYKSGNLPVEVNDPLFFSQCVSLGCIAFEVSSSKILDSNWNTFKTNVHNAGAIIWGFTLNDNALMLDRVNNGIDGIETDRPWDAYRYLCNNIPGANSFDSLTTGNWIFNGNLQSTHIGGQIRPYVYQNTLPQFLPTYDSCSAFNLPLINGVNKVVARMPAFDTLNGLLVHPNFRIEDDGISDGSYSIIMDILLPPESAQKYIALFQTSSKNLNDADLFISYDGQFGTLDVYHGYIDTSTWYRVCFTVDSKNGKIRKYLNGEFIGENIIEGSRWDVWNSSRSGDDQGFLLFTDDDNETGTMYISALQTRNYVLNDSQVKRLGAPSADGIMIGNANAWNVTLSSAFADSTILDFEHKTYYFVIPHNAPDSALLKMELYAGAQSNIGTQKTINVNNGSYSWNVVSEDSTQQKTWNVCIRRSSVNSALNEKVLNTKNIIVYPNPAKDIITLNGLENIEYEATILDIMGRNILTQSVTNSSNQIKLNGIVSGYYLLSIKHKNEIITKKVIVTN